MERSGQQKTLLEDLGFLIVILRLVTPGTDFPIPVHRSSAS